MVFIKKILLPVVILLLNIGCSSTGTLVMEAPQEGKSLVIGAILLENVGIEDVYEAKTAKITVILVGKFQEDGKEKIQGYRLKTDSKGYFALPNVPPGSYVVKGLEVDLAYTTHLLIGSRWEGNTQIYHPVENMIDYHVGAWPPEVIEKVINLNINYFQIDAVNRIFDQVFRSLQNSRLNLKDMTHTMPSPAVYFQEKYPDLGWFQ